MSATIHYRPTSKKDPYLRHAGAPSKLIETLERAFGGFPCDVGPQHVLKLEGMLVVSNDPVYQEIIDIIEKSGTIRLYAVY